MTRLHVEIGDLVLRGLPASYGESFGDLVRDRLEVLARGGVLVERDDPQSRLADQVAREVWSEVEAGTGGAR